MEKAERAPSMNVDSTSHTISSRGAIREARRGLASLPLDDAADPLIDDVANPVPDDAADI